MSEMYDTAIEWLEQWQIWNTLADLEPWAYGLLAAFIALPFIIRHLRKSKPDPTIQQRIKEFKKDKRLIEQKELTRRKWVGIACSVTAAVGCIHFGYRIGWIAFAGSVCISMLFWLFSTSVRRKWTWYNNLIDAGIIVCFIVFEVSVFTGSYSAQNADKGNLVNQEERDRKTKRMESLELEKTPINAGMSRRGLANAQYSNRTINSQIEDLEDSLPTLPQRGENEFFESLALALGVSVELAKLYFFFGLSSLFMVGTALNNTKYNSYYSIESLRDFINLLKQEVELTGGGGIKSGSSTTLTNKGTQKNKHNGSNAVDDGYSAVKAWIGDHSSGQVLSAKTMRSVMGTTSGNQTIIINRLKSNKLITQGKNGNRAEYKKAGVAVKAKVFSMFGK